MHVIIFACPFLAFAFILHSVSMQDLSPLDSHIRFNKLIHNEVYLIIFTTLHQNHVPHWVNKEMVMVTPPTLKQIMNTCTLCYLIHCLFLYILFLSFLALLSLHLVIFNEIVITHISLHNACSCQYLSQKRRTHIA